MNCKMLCAAPLLTLLLITQSACMMSPYDGEPIEDRTEKESFGGWVHQPNRLITLEIYEPATQQWHAFATTRSSQTASEYLEGTWYDWNTTAYLPRSARFWPSSGAGAATVRALMNGAELNTGSDDQWDCVINEVITNGQSPTEAYQTCDDIYGVRTEVVILGDCDVVKEGGCFDLSTISTLNDAPFQASYDFTEKLQGITHDNTYWYLTNSDDEGGLARVPLTGDLSSTPPVVITEPFPGFTHPGDLDHYNGWLYIALERGSGSSTYNAIGAVPTSQVSNKSAYKKFLITQGPQRTAQQYPWLARDPISGYFYSSLFLNASTLIRYKPTYDSAGNPSSFTYCGEVTLSKTLNRVQGGTFDPSGRLYLSTDPEEQTEIDKGLIKVVELSGHTLGHEPISCSNPPYIRVPVLDDVFLLKKEGGIEYEEVEGITFWDLDAHPTTQGQNRGQLHTILLRKRWPFDDVFYLKHHRITPQ